MLSSKATKEPPMGYLYYASSTKPIEVDDLLLQYLQIVSATKLRRHESFTMTLLSQGGSVRETIWMHSAIPLRFTFDGAEAPQVEMKYLQQLAQSASSASGLVVELDSWDGQAAHPRPSLVRAA
jgi:hypothetical protein